MLMNYALSAAQSRSRSDSFHACTHLVGEYHETRQTGGENRT